jgi:hypothetical protein
MIETESSRSDTTKRENQTMRLRRIALSLSALAVTIAIPLTAFADTTGGEGRIRSVEIVTPSADTYLQYHGRVFVVTSAGMDEYKWGGTACGSRTLSDEMLQQLSDATNSSVLRITPIYQDGQGAAKCLVGFTLRNKDVKEPV